jgi:hypothetical protein
MTRSLSVGMTNHALERNWNGNFDSKRLDAPHVRMYRWMLDSPAYLSLTCPARAVLIEIARGHDGMNNGRLGLSIRRASERCNIARGDCAARICRTTGARLHRLHDERSVQPKGTARHRMASHLVDLRCNWRTAQQKVHELGPRKTKRGIKISRRGIKSEPPRGVKQPEKSLTVPSFDTVRAHYGVVAVSI